MQLSDIKKSLFGYKKDDVYKYFAELSNDFSERLKKTEEASEKQIEELSKKNAELEEQIAILSSENAEYRESQSAIAESIIDAKKYADTLKLQNEQLVKAQREELMGEYSAAKKSAELLLSGVKSCKATIVEQLEKILSDLSATETTVSEKIEKCQKNIDILEESAYSESLSLFHLKKE